MTAAGIRQPTQRPVRGTAPGRYRPAVLAAGTRLVPLYLRSRRVPAALLALAACAGVLRAGLYWHWITGGPLAQQIPALIEAGMASVIAVTTYNPFGEPERATGRWLPWLRPGTAAALAGAAVGAVAASTTAGHLPDGNLAVLRNVGGLVGLGLLSAAVTGGALAWIAPMTYLVVTEYALLQAWRTPWIWAVRPPHDRGAAICAAAVFAAGILVVAVRGPRDSDHD